MIGGLGLRPSVAALVDSVERLVAIFRALAEPPRREITGAVGELCVILAATDCAAAIRAWHSDPNERYDFVAGDLRIDAKATAGLDRVHALTADQASPPPHVVALLASIRVRPAAGGTTTAQLLDLIIRRLGHDYEAILRLHEGAARNFGSRISEAFNYAFDLDEALSSLAFFDLHEVPALRPPFPAGLSDVRFRVDLHDVDPLDIATLRDRTSTVAANLLPH